MKIVIMTLGCKVNKYESESLARQLRSRGHEVSEKLESADVYIINTCAVTSEAERKSRQMIARCKKYNDLARVIVCGCASQKNRQQFEGKADYVSGVAGKKTLVDELSSCGGQNLPLPTEYEQMPMALPSHTRAYIKIQDGCNNFCTYCIIPYLRGRSRCRDSDSIFNEASALTDDVKEIVLTGINVADYDGLLPLLERLDTLGKRLRLSSMEKGVISEDFAYGLKKLKNFCPHFHLSLQSGSDTVLRRMNRHYTTQQMADSIKLLRQVFPNAAITTDVIVGFPEETDQEHLETLQFVKDVGFSDLHIFKYSPREGTIAAKMRQVDETVKKVRAKELESIRQRLSWDFIASQKSGEVLLEEQDGNFWVGHTKNYIKCFVPDFEGAKEGVEAEVLIEKPYLDGALCKLK